MSTRCGLRIGVRHVATARAWSRAIAVALVAALVAVSGGMEVLAQKPAAPRAFKGAALIALLKQPGHIAFMRHALAPFEGAPKEAGMTAEGLGPCSSQRNLDERGRADARRIGEKFRSSGVTFEHIYTSKWCRCRETAELIKGGAVENLPLINSFWTHPERPKVGPPQIAALKAYLSKDIKPTDRALMVTHGSLIEALTGLGTDESDIVVVKADGKGGITVIGYGAP